MVDVASLDASACPACTAEFSIDGNEIDHGYPNAYVDQAQVVSTARDLAAQDGFIEAYAARQIDHPKDEMIDVMY